MKKMKRILIVKRRRRQGRRQYDLRTPSGRVLPY
jgi:hypothetical protein